VQDGIWTCDCVLHLASFSWTAASSKRIYQQTFEFLADEELQYDHLAAGLAQALKADHTVFDAQRLKNCTGTIVSLSLSAFQLWFVFSALLQSL
jgi:hypothetical protein